jgi:hypothetical protein
MFKRTLPPSLPALHPRYLQIARNLQGRHYSQDVIRQVLIQRGLSWETALLVIAYLDAEQQDDERWTARGMRSLLGFGLTWYF